MAHCKGVEVYCAKLTIDEVRFIRAHTKTMRLKYMALKFPHVSKVTIFKVREFKTWKHIL